MSIPPDADLDDTQRRDVPADLRRLRGEVCELAETMWAARSGPELMETIGEVEALKSALDALQLGAVREIAATGACGPEGWASTQDYVTAMAGGHKGAGPAMVRLASAVAEPVLAPVAGAMSAGWLSTSKALVIERAVDALPSGAGLRTRAVQELLDHARHLDATDLKKVTRRLITVVDPAGEERRDERALDRLERAGHLGRHLSITADHAGGAWIKGRCSAEDAALLKATLMPLAAPVPDAGSACVPATCDSPGCSHDGRDPRDHGVRMLDALVEGCRRLQSAGGLLPESHGATPRLTLTMSLEDLCRLSGPAESDTGEQVSAGAVRRLCCDAEVIPVVLGGASEVLDVGRSRRLVTAAIWKALVARDAHCRFHGCSRPPLMCHAHHIEHWADGGATSLDNLVLLCGHHHRLVHSGPWQITRTGATLGFEGPRAVVDGGPQSPRVPSQRPPPDG